MKTRFGENPVRFALFALFIFLLPSCLDQETVVPEYAYFSIYHASPDAEDVDVYINQSKVNANDFAYGDYSKGYIFSRPGKQTLKLVDADDVATNIMDTTFTFSKNAYYSIFFAGMAENLEALLIKDIPSESVAANDEAFIRFIHLCPDAPEVDVYADEQLLFSAIDFKESAAFRKIKVNDEFTLRLRENAEVAVDILTKEDIDLTPKNYYTVIFKGLINVPEGNSNTKAIQVIKN